MRRLNIRLAMIASLLSLSLAPPVARAEDTPPAIQFSHFLLTWDLIQEIGWKGWMVQFPLSLSRWGQRQGTDGSAVLLNRAGDPKMVMEVRSELNDDRTQRLVELMFKDSRGGILLGMSFRTNGKDLERYDPALIRAGVLPFAEHDPGEDYTDMRMWVVDTFIFRQRIIRQREGDTLWTKVRISGADDTPFMTYTERVSPMQRYLRYDIETGNAHGGGGGGKPSGGGNQSASASTQSLQSLMVVRTLLPGQFVGNEEYYLNDRSTDAQTFRNVFDASITAFVVGGLQSGLASLLGLLQNPDGVSY